MNVCVIGSGILGQLFALAASRLNWQVEIFERLPAQQSGFCSQAAAGLLTPIAELEHAPDEIFLWGLQALQRWPKIIQLLNLNLAVKNPGSIWLAHANDRADFDHLILRLQNRLQQLHGKPQEFLQILSRDELKKIAPELLPQFSSGLWITQETAIPVQACLNQLQRTLNNHNVKFHFNCEVNRISANQIEYGSQQQQFDWVFDCRGVNAKDTWPQLRGVRGELIELYAPAVHLDYPIRLMHPRYALYIVPQGEGIYRVGASQIDSEDFSPISVQSMLELLTAAYSVHHGFLHGRVVKTYTQCRPCLPSAIPEMKVQPGLIEVNGLYRHGYLLAPILIEKIFKDHFNNPNIWQSLPSGVIRNDITTCV